MCAHMEELECFTLNGKKYLLFRECIFHKLSIIATGMNMISEVGTLEAQINANPPADHRVQST